MTDVFDRLCGAARGPVGIAVSGGSDSLALLVLARDWASRTRRPLIAFTVDHRLRPEAADEARFVAGTCAGMDVDHQTLVWDRPVAKQALARRARHGLMAAALRERGGDRLLLGHTSDDQCETVLMRARQGSTWFGLSGMQPLALSPVWPEGEGILLARPVLDRSRAGLRADLEQRGLNWVEDPSNRDPAYERVRIRRLLAGQEALKARLLACQGRFRLLRQLEERLIGRWMESCVRPGPAEGFVIQPQGLPPERAGRALGVMIQIAGGRDMPPRREALQPLVRRLLAGDGFSGATLGGVMIRRKQGDLVLRPEPDVAGDAADPARAHARFQAVKRLYLGLT